MRLGTQSLQSEEGVEFSPRKKSTYRAADGTTFEVVFAADAEVPAAVGVPQERPGGHVCSTATASSSNSTRTRPRFRAATGTCCSSAALAPNSKSCFKSDSTSLRARQGPAQDRRLARLTALQGRREPPSGDPDERLNHDARCASSNAPLALSTKVMGCSSIAVTRALEAPREFNLKAVALRRRRSRGRGLATRSALKTRKPAVMSRMRDRSTVRA